MRVQVSEPVLEDEGVGAKARRLIHGAMGHLDPFVLFDEYHVSKDAFFPQHPHSGFEGFQILMEGRTIYEDNQGNKGAIDPGDVRRFVAGKGFEHSERPDDVENVRGYLLWVKIPRKERNIPIIFKEEPSSAIPVSNKSGMKIRTIIGDGSPVKTLASVKWELIETKDVEGTLRISKTAEENGFIYVASGQVHLENQAIGPGNGVIMEGDGCLDIKVGKDVEMVSIKGKKLNESIVQKGHLVQW